MLRKVPVNVVTAPGRIEANGNRVSRILPPVPGRVAGILVSLGDAVKENQPVLLLESMEADNALAAAKQAAAAVRQAQSTLTKAEADLERLKALYAQQAIARKELREAENQEIQAREGLKQAEASLLHAQRRLQLLDLQPGEYGQRIVVRSPIAGKILEVNVTPGEFRNDPVRPLFTVADLSSVWITADVPETAIRFIQLGERFEAELSAYPGESFPGRVSQIADLVDPQTRTVKVRGVLENRKGKLLPEMFGRIRHIDSMQSVPCVPASAVIEMAGRSVLIVETAPGTYEQRGVQIGDPIGNLLPVLSGLRPRERIVVDGTLLVTGTTAPHGRPAT